MSTDSESVSCSSVEAWARGRLAVPGLAVTLRATLNTLVEELEASRNLSTPHFLSVVIRTQAKRWEQLQDAILCLAGQTDQDFEVILMLHDVSDERASRVEALVGAYPSEFVTRVRLIRVSGGGRTRPLAASVDHVRGAYVAFFDDDDLLLGNWVEAFHNAAEQSPGQLIRANVATQLNRIETWPGGAIGQRTVGVATAEYAKHFNLIDHLERNHTPFMGMAFPRTFFSEWGERFDEELPVCEDWDIALRAAGLLGVHSSEELTAIYRQWEDAQTSYTHHQIEEWRDAENRVRDKIDALPFFAPRGSISDALEVLGRERKVEHLLGSRLHEVLSSSSWRVTSPVRSVVRRLNSLLGRSKH